MMVQCLARVADDGPTFNQHWVNRLGGFALLNHNIYIVVDSTPVNVDHAAHAGCNNVK